MNDTKRPRSGSVTVDFTKATESVLKELNDNGFIKDCIKESVSSSIKKAIDDNFNSYSKFSNNIKAHIEKSLNLNLDTFTLVEYNQMLSNLFKEMLDTDLVAQAKEMMAGKMQEILEPLKSEWTLSEFIEELKKEWCQYEKEFERSGKSMTMIIEPCTILDNIHGYHIYLDENKQTETNRCNIRLYLSVLDEYRNKDNLELYAIVNKYYTGNEYPKARVNSVSNRNTDYSKILTNGNLFGVDKLLFKMFAQKVNILMDEDQVDTMYPTYD